MRKAFLALALTSCSSDPAPSCQQAVVHYYDSGCRLIDPTTSPPSEISVTQAIADCRGALVEVPDECQDEFDDHLSCMDSTPETIRTVDDCDCSQEQEALLRCVS